MSGTLTGILRNPAEFMLVVVSLSSKLREISFTHYRGVGVIETSLYLLHKQSPVLCWASSNKRDSTNDTRN